jgi:uracil-DNA glycosylase family 4
VTPPAQGDPSDLATLAREIAACRACPRLVAWREAAAASAPARFRGEPYWGRPVPGFGDPAARILLVGLAPARDGGNRTGRLFTGDRSGDFLFAALHRAGLASQAASIARTDGMVLRDAYLAAAVRCAPPGNRPQPDERDRCAPFLHREIRLLAHVRVIVALGAFAWSAVLRALEAAGETVPRPRPRFSHGAATSTGRIHVLGAYHPSQQNTFTGRVTRAMLDDVLGRARDLASPGL